MSGALGAQREDTPERGRPSLASAWAGAAAAALIGVVGLALRWIAASRGADNVDSVYFAAALDRYSLAELHPYFPGFPLFVGAGRIVRWFLADRYAALHVVSTAASLVALVPIGLVSADWRRACGGDAADARRSALAAALVWAALPCACVTGTEIASEPLALLLALAMLWAAGRVLLGAGGPWPLLTGLAAGLMLGVRLFHVFLMAPALSAALAARRRGEGRRERWGIPVGFVLGVAPWAGWQIAHEGSRLVEAGRAILAMHAQAEEYTLWSDPAPLLRPVGFLRTLYVHALGGWEPGLPGGAARALLVAGLLGLAAVGAHRLRRTTGPIGHLPLLWAVPFFAYIVAGQNVNFPRYALPFAALAAILAGVGVPRGRPGALVVAVTAGAAVVVTLALAPEHRREPVEFQLARALGGLDGGRAAFLVTENRRMLSAIVAAHAPALPAVWANPGEIASRTADLEARGRTVYATVPAPDRPEGWTPIGRFRRDNYFDRHLAREIWLFRHDGATRQGGR